MPIVGIFDVVGFVGAAIVLLAYFLNQDGRLDSANWRYPLSNLVGASLILISLTDTWNFPSAVIEASFVLISLWGIYRSLKTGA